MKLDSMRNYSGKNTNQCGKQLGVIPERESEVGIHYEESNYKEVGYKQA
jgi:hypothetical protein